MLGLRHGLRRDLSMNLSGAAIPNGSNRFEDTVVCARVHWVALGSEVVWYLFFVMTGKLGKTVINSRTISHF